MKKASSGLHEDQGKGVGGRDSSWKTPLVIIRIC